MKTISIAIPTYNRYELTLESFADVIDDPRIEEIVISDDASDLDLYYTLKAAVSTMPKVRIYRNLTNQDCYRNKYYAISLCKSEYAILLDSDNKIDKSYIDAIYSEEWGEDKILAPSWAMPLFDYREFEGLTISKSNVSEYMDRPFFATCLNCMNYFVNVNKYMEVWDDSVDPHSSDSIFQNYNWFKNGYNMKIVPNMFYNHKVHDQSHYKLNSHKSPEFYQKIEQELRNMK